VTPSSIGGPKLPFNLEHPWDQFVSDFLAERDLESTEFDSALGTIGGGNHFAELQTVEKVLDATSSKLGIGKQQLVVLVHSGSRGLGESILRAHVDQHFGNGVEEDSLPRRSTSGVTTSPCAGPRQTAN
jgi:release factor H-coupled RctB family protein